MPPASSMATVCTPTIASTIATGLPLEGLDVDGTTHSGINAGTSISPAPWPVDIKNDHMVRPARPAPWPRPTHRRHATAASSSTVRPSIHRRSIAAPAAIEPATSDIDATWPTAIGHRAIRTFAGGWVRAPQATAGQPQSGLTPCKAPAAAIPIQGHRLSSTARLKRGRHSRR